MRHPALAVALAATVSWPLAAASCDSLAKLALPHARITLAEPVAAIHRFRRQQ